MPQLALAITLGSLLAFYSNELPDQTWSAFLPILLFFYRYCVAYRFILLLAATFLWSSAVFHYHLDHRLVAAVDNQVRLVRGVVADIPQHQTGRISIYLKAVEIIDYPADMPRLVRLTWYQDKVLPRAGEKWQFEAKLRQARSSANPDGFDFAAWQFVRGVDATGYIRRSTQNMKIQPASLISVNYWRTLLTNSIEKNCHNCRHTGLIKALALGFRSDIADDQKYLLQSTGTAHLLAISGLHIALVAGIFFAIGRLLWRFGLYRTGLNRPQCAALISMGAAFGYAALAGFSLPTVRALVMFSVLLLALLCKSRINLLQSLCFGVGLILVADPRTIGSASFWLSAGALLVIAFVQFRLPRKMNWWQQLLLLQLFFSLLFMPLGILIFEQLNPASLLANIIAIPLISFVVLPMVLFGCLMLVTQSAVAQFPFYLADQVLGYLLEYLKHLVAAGLHAIELTYPVPLVMLGTVSLALLLMPSLPVLRKAGLLFLLLMISWRPERLDHGAYEMIVFDVGMGTSLLLRTRHHSLVYDFGPARPGMFSAAEWALIPSLRRYDIADPDLMIVSHVDQDHSGGLQSFTGHLRPYTLLSGTPYELKARFGLKHHVRSCHRYPDWRWDGVDFHFVSSSEMSATDSTNNRSCVLLVNGYHRTLLPGDIEASQEQKLVREHAATLQADVMLVPHHGSATSSSQVLLDQVKPRYAIHTLGRNNRWGFPKSSVTARYQSLGIHQYRSDQDGAVTMLSQSDSLSFKTSARPPRRFWRRW